MRRQNLRILVLMLQSIRATSNHGGSSKIVKEICTDLAAAGHRVTVLCARTNDNRAPFELVPAVRVLPALPFRQSWQDTWLVPPGQLHRIIATTAQAAEDADRILVFDSHFLYPDVFPRDTPIVWSLRDFVYVQALQGSMGFRRDTLVAPSAFVRNAYCDATSGWLPGIDERVVVVPNGVDLDRFQPVNGRQVRTELGLTNEPVLFFPHRPEEAKGLDVSLELCARLLERGWSRLRMLIHRGTDASIMPEVRNFYASLEHRIEARGLREHVLLRDWVSPHRMPEIYAAADVTLCLGDIVEACSNTTLESLACGTSVVASNIACYREFPPHVDKVALNDLDSTVRLVDDILARRRRLDVESARAELALRNGHHRMLGAFRDLIEQARVVAPLVPVAPTGRRFKVPAWISPQGDALYDEYAKVFPRNALLDDIWSRHGREAFDPSPVREHPEFEALVSSVALVAVS